MHIAKTKYANRTLISFFILNNEKRRPEFSQIAKQIDSPEQFTVVVLQNLTRSELLSTMKEAEAEDSFLMTQRIRQRCLTLSDQLKMISIFLNRVTYDNIIVHKAILTRK